MTLEAFFLAGYKDKEENFMIVFCRTIMTSLSVIVIASPEGENF